MELQWPLILFTSFMAWSAGLFGTQGVYALRGQAKRAQMPALFTALGLMIVGGIAVFLHLQHWERIFNGFGHLSSGITQELIAIVVMAVVMVIFFIYLRRSGDDAEIPAWAAIAAIVVALALLFVMAHSYMMASRPAWNNATQILSIFGAAFVMGPGTMAMIASLRGADDAPANGWTNIIGTIVGAITTVTYSVFMAGTGSMLSDVGYYFDPVGPTRGISEATTLSAFSGDALAFTVTALVCSAVAVICAFVGKKKGNWKLWGAIIAICGFVAAMCLRIVFYHMGASVYPFVDL